MSGSQSLLLSNFLGSKPMRVAVAAMTLAVTVAPATLTEGVKLSLGNSTNSNFGFLRFYSNNVSHEICATANKNNRFEPKKKNSAAWISWNNSAKQANKKVNSARQKIIKDFDTALSKGTDVLCLQEDEVNHANRLFKFTQHYKTKSNSAFDSHGYGYLTTHWKKNVLTKLAHSDGEFKNNQGRQFSIIYFKVEALAAAKRWRNRILIINVHAPHTRDMSTKDMMEQLNTEILNFPNMNFTKIGGIFMMGDFNRAIADKEVKVLGTELYNGFKGANKKPKTYVGFDTVPTNGPRTLGRDPHGNYSQHGPDAILSWVDPDTLDKQTQDNKYYTVKPKNDELGSDHWPIGGKFKYLIK